ncbi:sulfotransferase domain-containing protein [Litoreibacter albidus]|uniref:Sulfotransferase family protein n=1 Tax=Litoreibacter albidus TaxID=670155 RepID=A0A1H3DA79_9RHOB|nr:sulfotransferase domain-containing protein [Litoreibacter albidus]SDX62589.1 Sulfotransferase family protein [Litoreibacter albidus]
MDADPVFGHLFLSAGAMKAGTTWLYSVLDKHPSLFFSNEKEIHYFHYKYVDRSVLSDTRRLDNVKRRYLNIDPDRNFIGRVRNNLHWAANYLDHPVDDFWYRNLFALRRTQEYDCDFSNLYALLPADAWRKIQADCTKLRVLYTLRDPVKRLWSHVRFHLQITGQAESLAQWRPAEFEKFARQKFIWANSEYGSCLRRMRGALSDDAFKCIFFEDIHADQRKGLSEIEQFLGVPNHRYPDEILNKKVNASVSHPMPDFFPELFEADFRRIRNELEAEGLRIPQQWSVP